MREKFHTRPDRRYHPSRRVRLGVIAVSGVAALLAAACSSAPGHPAGGTTGHTSPSASPAAQLTITPASGTKHVNPSRGIRVTVAEGKISNVTVSTGSGGTYRVRRAVHMALADEANDLKDAAGALLGRARKAFEENNRSCVRWTVSDQQAFLLDVIRLLEALASG